jgi:chromosome segregation ATPase
MTREIGSLREMAEQAELRGEKAEAELREKKPELNSVLDSYEVVKKAYDQVLEEKFSLEQDIKKLEYSTAQDQGREETAKAEKKDMVRRVKELSTEIKQMKATNTSNRKESGELKKKVRTLQALADTAEKKMEDALEKLDKESKKSKELETKTEALRFEMRDPREVAEQLDSVRDLTKDYKERAKQHAEDAKKERVRQKLLGQELRTLQKADKANSDVRNKLNTQLVRNKKELDKATAKLTEAERKLESEKDRRRELVGQLKFLSDSLKENLSEAQLSEKIEGIKTEAILAKDDGASALASAEQMTRENQDLEKKLDDVRKMSVTDDSKAAETAKEALESVIPTSKIGSSLVVKNLIKETEHTYRLVKALSEQDMARGVLSIENPLGKELFGTMEGQEFSMGNTKFKILKIKN